jgi:murein L,D-transpeptidase YcbB/YkuD
MSDYCCASKPLRPRNPALIVACLFALSGCVSGSNSGPTQAVQPQPEARTEREIESPGTELRHDAVPLTSEETRQSVETAIDRYQRIVDAGGWPTIRDGPNFKLGDGDERATALVQHLRISGDLRPRIEMSRSQVNLSDLEAAVQQFQARHGIRSSGIVDRETIDALNVTADARLAQLRANLVRIRDVSTSVASAKRYVLVNIPAFQLEGVEAERVVERSRVIVGKPARPTPSVKAFIKAINFFPDWHVPDSVSKLDLVPRLQNDPAYLKREHIRVLKDWQGPEISSETIDWRSSTAQQFKFQQDPGPWNALGLVRIDMLNEHSVYMHDTPMKRLFGQRRRDFSAGCVRVEAVFDVASWLMRDIPGWDRAKIDKVLVDGKAIDISLANPVPVQFTYVTAWASPDGRVDFRADIYGWDGIDRQNARQARESLAAETVAP